jgi:hypothetical protein
MMKEGVIITKISIKRQGERKHFQIKLPKDTKFIIGVEYGGRLIDHSDTVFVTPFLPKSTEGAPSLETGSGTTVSEGGAVGSGGSGSSGGPVGGERSTLFKRNQLIGELKLQSCEEANWFYSADVFANDVNLSYGDFSQSGFRVNDFSHGTKRTEEIVKIDVESTIIQGWYLDALGKTKNADIRYEVTVYVWINVEE